MEAMLRLQTLGTPSVSNAGGPLGGAAAQRKSLALLGLLAPAGDRGVSRDRIIAYLWPEAAGDRAGHRLTQLLYSLRRDLEADDLFLGTSEIRLNPAIITTDVEEFRQALAAGEAERAVDLYGGPFLDGFFLSEAPEFEQWVESERADLARRYRTAVEELACAAGERGDHAAAAACWRRLAEADPLNARVVARQVASLAAAGDRATALRAARLHELRMREELDAPPDPLVLEALERVRVPVSASQPAAGQVAPGEVPAASIAVLPFLNLSPERENEYFADGITEELTNVLAGIAGLRVASRTSAFALKGKGIDAREIGERLRVATLLEGSVRKIGSRIRLTAQLVSAADGYNLWSRTYERTLDDVFLLQEELARAIAQVLPLDPASPAALVRPGTTVPEAYSLFLRGRYFAVRRTPEHLRVAIEYFEQAVERDPEYALAHAGLAECWVMLGFDEFGDLPPREAMPKAKAAVLRSLELDPESAAGHTWRGAIAFLYDYDWALAELSFRRAIEAPGPVYALAHTWLGIMLCALGRQAEGLAQARHAARLEPLSMPVQVVVGVAEYYNDLYADAIARYRALLEVEPDNVRLIVWACRVYRKAGRYDEGLALVEQALAKHGDLPLLLSSRGVLLAAAGRHAEAEQVLEQLRRLSRDRYVSLGYLAPIVNALGREDETLDLYERLFEERSGYVAFFLSEPVWRMRADNPRYRALVSRVGLPI
jgi:adenylate cyclase